MANQLENIKQDIRSILLTAPRGMQLDKLCREYRELIGQNLPCKELGYSSPEEFLKHIPDVVSLDWFPQLNSFVLKAVADEKTSHIEKLVSKQKVSKKNTLTAPKKRNRHQHVSQIYIPPGRMTVKNQQPKMVPPRFQNTNACYPIPKAVIPATVRMDVIKLLEEYPRGIGLQNLTTIFQRKFGKELRFRAMGFTSLEEFLMEVTEVEFGDMGGRARVCLPRTHTMTVLTSRTITPMTPPYSKKIEHSPPALNIAPPIPQKEPLTPERIPSISPSNSIPSLTQGWSPISEQFDASGISHTMKENFRKILKENPQGVWAAEFPEHYKELTGYELDFNELGFYSLLELVHALPDVFRKTRPPGCMSDWQLFDASGPESCSPIPKLHDLHTAPNTSYANEVIANVRKILQANPEGVYLDDFIHLYCLNCEGELSLSKLNCSSIEKFLLAVADKVPLKFNYSNARKKIHYAHFLEPAVSPPVYRSPSRMSTSQIPDDAVRPGTIIEWQKPPIINNYFKIYIGTIVDPDLIWIQLNEKTEALDALMRNLDKFYKSAAGDNYVMSDRDVMIGSLCAAPWSGDGAWHRASIIGIANMEEIFLLYVDYGTREKVKRTKLRYLRTSFMDLPAQAIKSRMAFVKPKNGETWDPKVRDKLMVHVRDKIVLAEIVPKSPEEDRIAVWICDTSKEVDLHLNKMLLDDGLADFRPEEVDACNEKKPSRPNPPPGNFPSPPSSSSASTSNALSETLDSTLHSMNMSGSNGTPINVAVLDQLIRSGIDLATIIRIMGLSTNAPVNNVPQNAVLGATASPFTSNYPSRNNSYQSPHNYNSNFANYPPTLATVSPHLVQSEKKTSPRKTENYLEQIKSVERSQPVCNQMDNSDSSEVFEEDDDDEFEQFFSAYSTKSQRFVRRINLRHGYRFHIVVVEQVPYVASGDISKLLWSNDDNDCLSRRLRGKSVAFPSIVISDKIYPDIFQQLESYKVKGIRHSEDKKVITLYLLNNIIEILNMFGHPSPTIRVEIFREIKNFDLSDPLWQSFSELHISDDDRECVAETDSDKFKRLCIFDLKSGLEALRFKRLKILNGLATLPNGFDHSEQLKKIEKQFDIYEERIKQIEAIIADSNSELI